MTCHAFGARLCLALALLTTAAPASAQDAATAASCRPPRHYHFELPRGDGIRLSCKTSGTAIFNVTINDAGRAVARAVLPFANTSPTAIYYHSTQIDVGAPIIAYGSGADVCPRSRALRAVHILGFGTISSGKNRVQVRSHQGAAPCVDGQMRVTAGAVLDVWVEDDAPHCVGRNILVTSHQANVRRRTGKNEALFAWDANPIVMHRFAVRKQPGATRLKLLSSVEGTPKHNPNSTCGRERARLAIEHRVNGEVVSRQSVAVPASLGMGHAMLGLETDLPLAKMGDKINAGLYVRKDFHGTAVSTGGCCGDGVLALIQY